MKDDIRGLLTGLAGVAIVIGVASIITVGISAGPNALSYGVSEDKYTLDGQALVTFDPAENGSVQVRPLVLNETVDVRVNSPDGDVYGNLETPSDEFVVRGLSSGDTVFITVNRIGLDGTHPYWIQKYTYSTDRESHDNL